MNIFLCYKWTYREDRVGIYEHIDLVTAHLRKISLEKPVLCIGNQVAVSI